MILAAVLISPSGFHNLIHGVPLYAILGLFPPIAGWPIFLTEFAFPTSEGSRSSAVIKLWLGGSVMVSAVINLRYAVLNYSPVRPGLSPTARLLLAGFVSACSSRVVFGALSQQFFRAPLQFAER
jgi:hypothetical protein